MSAADVSRNERDYDKRLLRDIIARPEHTAEWRAFSARQHTECQSWRRAGYR